MLTVCLQVSLKSTACPGRDGKNLKESDFKYNRKSYWLTSREAPNTLWIEELMPSCDVVKAYVARDKSYVNSEVCYLDCSDSFDSFLMRWKAKTLITEYDQVPLKTGAVGQVYPHFTEMDDLLSETKESKAWQHFLATGEQDLEGFEGDDDDEVRVHV